MDTCTQWVFVAYYNILYLPFEMIAFQTVPVFEMIKAYHFAWLAEIVLALELDTGILKNMQVKSFL